MPPRPMVARAEAAPDCELSQRELASPRPPPPPGAGDWRAWMGPLVLSGSRLASRRLVGVLGDGDAISACTSVRPTGLSSGLGPWLAGCERPRIAPKLSPKRLKVEDEKLDVRFPRTGRGGSAVLGSAIRPSPSWRGDLCETSSSLLRCDRRGTSSSLLRCATAAGTGATGEARGEVLAEAPAPNREASMPRGETGSGVAGVGGAARAPVPPPSALAS
mmetsp:Transcript_12625/g.31979  ORF Transcript_12625/g.31979 Transcript_12625/m.31979 type:complete len:218 (-) Transcript_12625:639-1292(-)